MYNYTYSFHFNETTMAEAKELIIYIAVKSK